MRRVGSREGKGWFTLLICGHSQTWIAVVLTTLPDTNGQVEVEGRDLGHPGGFQSPQIKVACHCPSPAQATGARQGGRQGRKLSPTKKRFGGGEPPKQLPGPEREAVVEDGRAAHQPWTAQLQTYREEKYLTH